MLKFIQSYITDIGTKRKTNQDSLSMLKADTDMGEVLMVVMCDGMGGHSSGELASKIIVKAFDQWFKKELPSILYTDRGETLLKISWTKLIRECNHRLVSYGAQKNIELGSTMTVFLFVDRKYYFAHVGDSRAYAVSQRSLQQLTADHSLIAEEVRQGLLTEEEAKKDHRKNILLECVGITEDIEIDFYYGNTVPGYCYLVCTDGFWHYITERDLTHGLAEAKINDNRTMRTRLQYLVEQVKLRGEKDNISVVGVIPGQEQRITRERDRKFEVILDIAKVNTSAEIEG